MRNKQIKWNLINAYKTKFSSSLTYKNTCPICNSKSNFIIQKLKKFQFYTDSHSAKKIDVKNVMCKKCYTVYQNPIYNKKGLKVLFNEAGMSYGSTYSSKIDQINWLKKNKLIKKNLSILDVGCFDGSFLKMMPKNTKKFGLDINKDVILKAKKENKKIKFFSQNFETFKTNIKFDLILMMHVLEHLPNPLAVLKNLKKISKENASLIIEVPILENHILKKLHQLEGFISVQHVTHFTEKSLSNIVNQSGWKILKKKKIDKYNGYRLVCKKSDSIKKININLSEKKLFKKYLNDYKILKKTMSTKISKTIFSKNIVIYGAGLHLETIYHTTNFFKINKSKKFIILDSSKFKEGKSWRGINIYGPEIINSLPHLKNYKFVISSYPYQTEIEFLFKNLNIKSTNIFKFYDNIRRY